MNVVENSDIVTITDKAINQIIKINEGEGAKEALRVAVIGGGCSGLSYKIDFSDLKETDNIIDFPTFKVAIDPKSAIYLKGVTLDFQDGLNGKGFVFNNPNAKNSCGCGESFSV